MITGLYSAAADSIPILCLVGQAPVAKMHKEDFQAVNIAAISAPLTKMSVTVMEGAQLPGTLQKAFQLMRSGRPGPVLIDLPIDVQLSEIEFDIDTYVPLVPDKPSATQGQATKALQMINESEKPVLIAGGGVINADASEQLVELAEILNIPVIPTLMGWGTISDAHPLQAGMVGIQTSQLYGNANFLASDFVVGIGNRWANRHTGGLDKYRAGRKFIHIDIEPTQIGRIFPPDFSIVADAKSALDELIIAAKAMKAAGKIKDRSAWVAECQGRKAVMHRRTNFDNVPVKPQRVYQEMNTFFGEDTIYVTTIGLSQIAGAQFLHVYKPRHWINAAQAGALGWTVPAALGVAAANPKGTVVGLSGDYDFQFLIEELAVGAQFNLPFIHVLVNNSYLGLIRQAQRVFEMDYSVQLAFENINSPEVGGYGVDHMKVVEGLGCKGIRITDPNKIADGFKEAKLLMEKYKVPVVVEIILEKITNISMGPDLDAMTEFEELATLPEHAPTEFK
jgi:tartronate-semialdehyde synthase